MWSLWIQRLLSDEMTLWVKPKTFVEDSSQISPTCDLCVGNCHLRRKSGGGKVRMQCSSNHPSLHWLRTSQAFFFCGCTLEQWLTLWPKGSSINVVTIFFRPLWYWNFCIRASLTRTQKYLILRVKHLEVRVSYTSTTNTTSLGATLVQNW